MSSFTPTHSFLLRSYFLCKILFFSSLTGLGGLLQGSHTNNYITKGTNATCLRNLYYSFTILTSSTYSKLGVPKNDNTLLSYLNLPLSTNHTLNYVQLWSTSLLYRFILRRANFYSKEPGIHVLGSPHFTNSSAFFPSPFNLILFKSLVLKKLIQKTPIMKGFVVSFELLVVRLRSFLLNIPTGGFKHTTLNPLFSRLLAGITSFKFYKKYLSSLAKNFSLKVLFKKVNHRLGKMRRLFFKKDTSTRALSYSGRIKLTRSNMGRVKLIRTTPLIYNKLIKSGALKSSYQFLKSVTWSNSSLDTHYRSSPVYFVNRFKTIFFKKLLQNFCIIYSNPFLLKTSAFLYHNTTFYNFFFYHRRVWWFTNLIPSTYFSGKVHKKLIISRNSLFFSENVVPWVYSNLVRFIEFCSGQRSLIQVHSFMNQSIDSNFVILYKMWLPRLSYYERRLGHKFFLEEAFHILHMGLSYQDVKLISLWLKAIIKRVSFWKTRIIFRFIKFLFNNYFFYIFNDLGIKGFKVKLKGKISVAGNSRKRVILYRVGQTSHATCNLKTIHRLNIINTFTGALGLQVWIFY